MRESSSSTVPSHSPMIRLLRKGIVEVLRRRNRRAWSLVMTRLQREVNGIAKPITSNTNIGNPCTQLGWISRIVFVFLTLVGSFDMPVTSTYTLGGFRRRAPGGPSSRRTSPRRTRSRSGQ